MVANGLYEKVPIPDIVLGQHIHAIKAGVVALNGEPVQTAVDSFEIRIYGKSGHVFRPDLCVDPVITTTHIVLRLQNILTKETRPEDFAIMTCTSIHLGAAVRRMLCLILCILR